MNTKYAHEELKEIRFQKFKKEFLPRLENYYPIQFFPIACVCVIETIDYGIINFYPKSNSLLIRKTNRWIKPGLQFIVQNLLKKSDNAGK